MSAELAEYAAYVVIGNVFAKKIAVLYRVEDAILFKAGVKGCCGEAGKTGIWLIRRKKIQNVSIFNLLLNIIMLLTHKYGFELLLYGLYRKIIMFMVFAANY